jgi:hypothetical protein
VKSVIHGGLPTIFQRILKLGQEVGSRFLFGQLWNERLFQVLDIFERGEFVNASIHHHHEKGNKEVGSPSQSKERLRAVVPEPEIKVS